ncbi:MAG: Ig-like domain-containing protein [Reyranella sp.]|uniref:Ig-like domain-containing protein n=3 Tax=Reyranella sp. TaxID=1929291 RepID=UPI003D0B794E
MPLSAAATIIVAPLSQASHRYTIILGNTGDTPIGSFWFSWLPGEGYLPDQPTFASPAQWTAQLTDGPPNNGYSILWQVTSSVASLLPGHADGFTFSSTVTPDVLFGTSTIHPPTPVTTSVVYVGGPLSVPDFTLVATQETTAVASVSISVAVSTRSEGNSASTPFTFTVTRTGDTSAAHSVAYAVSAAAVFPVDADDFAGHVLPSGTVVFLAGETTKTITVDVAGDTDLEASENFVVTLSAPSLGLSIDTASATGKIVNDDSAPPVSTIDDAYIVIAGQPLTVGGEASVLVNDEGGPTLAATLLSGPSHGDMVLAANGTFTYTPDPGFTGIDGFTYRASNFNGQVEEQGLLYVVPVSVGASTTLDLLALTAPEQIAATYVAFFGRGADAPGHSFWVGQFEANLPSQGPAALFANIASSFGISAEAKALYPFLEDPFAASDAEISSFLDSVYDNMFNRSSDAAGLAYWTGQIKATLQAGQFVGSVLVNIMSGAQNSAAGQDITTLMGKVAVNLEYVAEQKRLGTTWTSQDDGAEATALLSAVTDVPQTVLVGMAQAHSLVAADV